MARSPKDPGAEHVFMSKEDQVKAYELFKRFFGKKLSNIRKRLEDGLIELRPGGSLSIVEFRMQRIPRGLISIIDNSSPLLEEDIINAYFFLHYFMQAINSADEQGVISLKGRLNDALNHKQKFCDLFWELAVANTYMSNGNSVEFIPTSKEPSVRTPEMIIRGTNGKLWIECKCTSILSRPPMPEELLSLAIASVKTHLVFCPQAALIAKIHYRGDRNVDIDVALNSLRDAIHQITVDNLVSACALWEIRIIPDHELTHDLKAALLIPTDERPEILQGFAIVPIGDCKLLVFSADKESGFDQTVWERVRDAIDQLPDTDLRIVYIQSLGYIPTSESEFNSFGTWALGHSRTISKVKAKFRMNDGFLGVNINTDFWFEEREGSYFINYLSKGLDTPHINDLYIHQVEMLGKPKELFEKEMMDVIVNHLIGAGRP